MRTTVRVALGAAAAVLAGIVAPAAAQAAPPSLGPTINTLPAFASDGGGGTPQLDSAVSNACASGATLAAAEWFTLAQDAWGPVLVDADREIGTTGRSPYLYSTTHTAFERASERPVEGVKIRYDRNPNLVAGGIVPRPRPAPPRPEPFPGFVPDPRG